MGHQYYKSSTSGCGGDFTSWPLLFILMRSQTPERDQQISAQQQPSSAMFLLQFLLQCSLSNPCHDFLEYACMQGQGRIRFIFSVWHLARGH